MWTVTSSTHKPEATGLDLWMTRSADSPKCRPKRNHTEYESGQMACLASSLPTTRQLQTPGLLQGSVSHQLSQIHHRDTLNVWPTLHLGGRFAELRYWPDSSSAGHA